MTQEIRPEFFIAGGPKFGTTALYEYLRSHPDILMPFRKDLYFFATDLPGKRRIRSWSQYQQTFSSHPDGKRVGEASALYLFSKDALRNIRELNPQSRIIALVRNPIDVAIAYHSQQVFNLAEDVTDFERAWRLREERQRGERIPRDCPEPRLLQYQAVASLGTQVERLLNCFPPSQVKLILFDDFISDTRQIYTETLEFLGLRQDERNDFPPVNERKAVQLAWLKRIEQSVSMPIAVSKTADALGVRRLKEWIYRRSKQRYTPDAALLQELVQTFESEINILEHLLQRDLTPWLRMERIPASPVTDGGTFANDDAIC